MLRFSCRIAAFIAIVALLLDLGLFADVARAQDNSTIEYWTTWKLELDFTQGDTAANWTVFLGSTDTSTTPPTKAILSTYTTDIKCAPHGNFQISGGEAIFDGQSHLECALPSYYHVALDLAQKLGDEKLIKKITEHCTCVGPIPWVTGDVTIEPSELANPLIYEINGDFTFATPLVPGTLHASSNLYLNGQLMQPTNGTPYGWPIKNTGNVIWSGFGVETFALLKDAGWAAFLDNTSFASAAQNTPAAHYLAWEASGAPQNFALPDLKFSLTNLETTILIGSDGDNHFVGKMRKLGFDPGCTAE